jgi:hypothetical protein
MKVLIPLVFPLFSLDLPLPSLPWLCARPGGTDGLPVGEVRRRTSLQPGETPTPCLGRIDARTGSTSRSGAAPIANSLGAGCAGFPMVGVNPFGPNSV